MKPIKITDYQSNVGDLARFRKDIRDRICEKIFSYDTLQDINYLALKQIYPINKTVKNNEKSIEIHARKVIKHFKLSLNRSSLHIGLDGKLQNREEEITFTVYFQWT